MLEIQFSICYLFFIFDCVFKKCNVNYINKEGETCLNFAVKKGRQEMVEFLINHGAEVNIVNSTDKETALHQAARASQVDIVRTLLENGADPSLKGNKGSPAEVTSNNTIKKMIENYVKMRSALEKIGVAIPTSTEEFRKELSSRKDGKEQPRRKTTLIDSLKRTNKRSADNIEVGEPQMMEEIHEEVHANPLHGKKLQLHNPLFEHPVQPKEPLGDTKDSTGEVVSPPVLHRITKQSTGEVAEKRKSLSNETGNKRRSMTLFHKQSFEKEQKETKEKELKDVKESKEQKDLKETKEMKDLKDSKDPKDTPKSPTVTKAKKKEEAPVTIGEPTFVGKGPSLEEIQGQTGSPTSQRPKKTKERNPFFASLKRDKKTDKKI